MGVLTAGRGKMQEALRFFKTALEAKPNIAQFWLSYINALIKLGRAAEAQVVFKQAKDQGAKGAAFDQLEQQFANQGLQANKANTLDKPQDPPAQQLQSIINLYTQGQLKQALATSSQMLERFPNSVVLYNIAGAANVGLMQFDAAIANYKQALRVKPDYAEAYYNMGIALGHKGDPEAAINSYNKALKIKPNYAAVKSNLVDLLTFYTPQKQSSNPIVAANESIRKIDIKDITSSVIADDQVVNVFSKSLSCISSSGVEVRTKEEQAYRRNTAPLNCKRHMSIFKQHDVIPKFCFGCYKVQVEPKSIIELIKVFFVLDQLQLNKNNNRKCMIELRPDVPGFYKGLIYCSGLNEANQIAEQFNTALQQSIGPGLVAKVKRGCSEYPSSYPDYKEINNSGPQLMNYNEGWKVVEADYDRENPTRAKENLRSTVTGLNLSDILTIRKWVDYAKGIGDPSVNLLNQNAIYDQKTYELAKARLDQHPFSP